MDEERNQAGLGCFTLGRALGASPLPVAQLTPRDLADTMDALLVEQPRRAEILIEAIMVGELLAAQELINEALLRVGWQGR